MEDIFFVNHDLCLNEPQIQGFNSLNSRGTKMSSQKALRSVIKAYVEPDNEDYWDVAIRAKRRKLTHQRSDLNTFYNDLSQ